MRIFACLLVAAMTISASMASAFDMPPMMKTGGMDTMRWLIGSWGCSYSGGAMGAGKVTLVVQDVPAHHVISYVTHISSADNTGYIGYSEKSKMFFNPSIDSGGGYGSESSDGWSEATMPWTGTFTSGGKTTKVRDTYLKISDSRFTDTDEAFVGTKWTLQARFVCTKK